MAIVLETVISTRDMTLRSHLCPAFGAIGPRKMMLRNNRIVVLRDSKGEILTSSFLRYAALSLVVCHLEPLCLAMDLNLDHSPSREGAE